MNQKIIAISKVIFFQMKFSQSEISHFNIMYFFTYLVVNSFDKYNNIIF